MCPVRSKSLQTMIRPVEYVNALHWGLIMLSKDLEYIGRASQEEMHIRVYRGPEPELSVEHQVESTNKALQLRKVDFYICPP